ncbi:MAG: alpha/beta fold hydrolase [Chthoniobacterales bacterium]|nr:alpha/beta fold hydrolase [Chthoniobacterales bacterium]
MRGYPTATDAFLLVDYPGYGKCQGYATIASTRASTEAAVEALARRIGVSQDELEPKLCAIGHSLGAAVALDFAARHRVSRAVLIAPFTTLREESARVVGGPLSHLLIENYDNRARLTELTMRNSHARIGIFHGINDGVIPVQMGCELSGLSPQIDFFPIAGVGHVTVFDIAHDRIIEWMSR